MTTTMEPAVGGTRLRKRVGDRLVRVAEGGRTATVFDLTSEGITHLHG